MPEDPLMRWETEGGAVLPVDDGERPGQARPDAPEAKTASGRLQDSPTERCGQRQADGYRVDDQALGPP